MMKTGQIIKLDCAHRVKFDLFKLWFNSGGRGRHLAEFMPGTFT